jgi:galactokinase
VQEHRALRTLLGSTNQCLCRAVIKAMAKGDASSIGYLLSNAQDDFDAHATPLCPEQLAAPKLHAVMAQPDIQPLIWGAKGLGSQGDGAAQLLCKSEDAMKQVVKVLEAAMDVSCIPLTLQATASNGKVAS